MKSFLNVLKKKLFHPYKLYILDEVNLKQDYQRSFLPIYVYSILCLLALIILIPTFLLLFKPSSASNTLIYDNSENLNQKNLVIEQAKEIERLKDKVQSNNQYIESLRNLMSPVTNRAKLDTTIREVTTNVNDDELLPTPTDSLLREQVAKEELSAINEPAINTNTAITGLLFPPLKGAITSEYNIAENHLAVDIAAKEGESIKAAEEGVVLFTDFTTETGYVIILKHPDNLLTVYKHNSLVYKEIGDFVERGEVIAAVGNTGEFSTGPHLHFEVWLDGKQVNPETYVDL